MLNSLIGTELTLSVFLICTAVSLVLGIGLALVSQFRARSTQSFAVTLAILPMVVQVVIMLVNGNIGAGVAVAGAFSLVRFRSAPGTAREIGVLFLGMAIGLATGMGYVGLAALTFVIAAAAGADMLPVRIIYGSKDGRLHLFCKVRIVFGEPIPAADLQIRDQSHKMAELRRMKNRLRDELEQLLADNAFAVRLAETAAEEPAAPDDKPQLPE